MHIPRKNIEKRKEPRFGLSILCFIIPQANITSGKALTAKIEDISLHGLKSSIKNNLQPGQDVEVCYVHAESGQKIRLLGRIKWRLPGHEKYKLGIELYHKNSTCLTLYQDCSYLLQSLALNPSSSNPGPRENTSHPAAFQNELFWGLFLKTFQKMFEDNLIHLSSEFFLSSAYLEKILQDMSLKTIPQELANKIEGTLSILQKANNDFLKFINIFQIMLEESIFKKRAVQENTHQKIDLNILLEQRIKSFKHKLDCLMIPEQNQFFRKGAKVKKIIGSAWKINIGLDLLLLHSYQVLLVRNATRIGINLNDHQDTIQLDFENDGSGIFCGECEQLILKLNQDINCEGLRTSDMTQLAWLQYALCFFKEFNPVIIVKNNSGNNVVSLCLHEEFGKK